MEEPTQELLHSAVNKRCDKSFESAQYLRKHELICLVRRATYLGSFLQDLRLNPIEKINSDVAYCWLYSLGTGSLPPLKTPGKAGVPGLLGHKSELLKKSHISGNSRRNGQEMSVFCLRVFWPAKQNNGDLHHVQYRQENCLTMPG